MPADPHDASHPPAELPGDAFGGTGQYPPAVRQAIDETIHGRRVADPYRWLEDATSPATTAWSTAEDELFASWASGRPERDRLVDDLLALVPGYRGAPTVIGDRRFWVERRAGQDHGVVLVADGDGTRTLVDPNAIDADGKVTLDGWSPSLEGDLLAYLLSSGGDEESRLWVVDVTTGAVVDGPVDRLRYTDLAWLPGGGELLYVRRLPPGDVPAGEEMYHRRVWRHRIGADPATDVLVFGADGHGPDVDRTAYLGVEVSDDGERLAVTVSVGTAPRNDLYLARLPGPGGGAPEAWTTVLEGLDAQAWPGWDRRGALWVVTDLDAPRRRLVRVDPDDPAPAGWSDVLPEDPDGGILDGFVLAGDDLVALRSRHALSAVSVHDRVDGTWRRDVVLPGPGSAGLSGRPDEGPDVWLAWTDYTTPPAVLTLDPSTGGLAPAPDPRAAGAGGAPSAPAGRPAAAPDAGPAVTVAVTGPPAAEGVHARVVTYRSADGTEVRMTVVSPAEGPTRPRPTVLYGYGGFDVALTPAYSSTILAWVRAGGVWAVANLRGGSEEGEAWHRDGMREHKVHVFEDFEAAADALVAGGWTTPDRLGIMGGSNGGLLVGAALTRDPSRYRAVVCSAPLLDMVRYERFGLGATWNDEYGTADDPTELGWLLGYSPYHHVERGTVYPSVLFTIFDGDSRVDTLHARKMAAALQWATAGAPGERPVLVRREADVGHGARSVRRSVELAADELAFLATSLGLDWPVP